MENAKREFEKLEEEKREYEMKKKSDAV